MAESLSDKIASILSTAPATFDPEDDVHEETAARVVEKSKDLDDDNEEITLSQFRKQNVQLLENVDKRYDGKKSSRNQLLDSDEWENEEDEDSPTEFNGAKLESSEEENYEDSGGEETSEVEEDSEHDGNDEIKDNEDFKHVHDSDVFSQVKKGECVRQQLSMWESLLEMRIQLQKCLVTANKLPQTDAFNELYDKCGSQFSSKVSESKRNVNDLLEKLLYLQLLLLRKYPETKNLLSGNTQVSKSEENDEEIPSDTEDEESNNPVDADDDDIDEVPRKRLKMKDYKSEIDKRYNLYKNYQNSVIKKWDDKTRIANSKPGNIINPVSSQIEHILSDKPKLIKRTQLKRTDYDIVGLPKSETSSEEYIENIFDDTDFYHQLLRELIEYKSADITDPVQLGRQWIQLQNLRSKMKRNIDTRATKGRKIRYVVHTKLVNFMAPIDEGTWQDEAKSELFNSLFGKNQPKNTI